MKTRRKIESKKVVNIVRLPDSFDEELVGMSRTFAKAFTYESTLQKWTLNQQKIFFLILSNIDWKNSGNSNFIEIIVDKAQEKLNVDYAKNQRHVFSKRIVEDINSMIQNSFVSLQDPITKKWTSDNLINHADGDNYIIHVELNKRFMNHFERLYEAAKMNGINFISFSEFDIYQMCSSFGTKMFIDLLNFSNHNGSINHRDYTTKQLKDLFGLPKDAYCRNYDYEKNTFVDFDRTNFEKKVLNKALTLVNNTEAVDIIPYEDGKLYKKIKDGRRVRGYEVQYRVYNIDSMKKRRERQNNYVH